MLSHVLSTWIEMFTKENKLTKSALSKLKIWAGLALLFSWQKQISNFMHGLKSAILALFQPCPASAALQSGSQIFCLLYLNFYLSFFNMKPLSEVGPGLLVVQIQIQAVCYVTS